LETKRDQNLAEYSNSHTWIYVEFLHLFPPEQDSRRTSNSVSTQDPSGKWRKLRITNRWPWPNKRTKALDKNREPGNFDYCAGYANAPSTGLGSFKVAWLK